MKTIIVPLDFSEQAEYALRVAASLARKHNAGILALHMLELNQAIISSSEGYYQEHTVFMMKLAEKRMREFLDAPYLAGINITPVLKHFKVFGAISEVAEKHNADLVVMGSHGTDGLKEIFIGSNAEKVVRHSEIPVLVIKDRLDDFIVKDFVFACDFRKENLNAFQKASDFSAMLDAKMHLLYINTPGEDFLSTRDIYKRISTFLKNATAGLKVEVYNDYSVEQGVLHFSEEMNADLIGIPTHGRKGLAHFFRGSIGEDIANHSKIPVVTFRI